MLLLDKRKKKREEESDTTLNANIFAKSCAAKFHSSHAFGSGFISLLCLAPIPQRLTEADCTLDETSW